MLEACSMEVISLLLDQDLQWWKLTVVQEGGHLLAAGVAFPHQVVLDHGSAVYMMLQVLH